MTIIYWSTLEASCQSRSLMAVPRPVWASQAPTAILRLTALAFLKKTKLVGGIPQRLDVKKPDYKQDFKVVLN